MLRKFLFVILFVSAIVPAVADDECPVGYGLTNYTQLEYIRGDKKAYLKSGITLDNNSSVEAKFQFPNMEGSNTGNFICGARNSGPSKAFILAGFSYGIYWAANYNNSVEHCGISDTNIHVMKRDKEKVYFDGSLVLTSASAIFTTPGEAYIFSANQYGAPYLTSDIKLWYLKIWDNEILVRDFIPAQRKSDGVIGMYDTVSRTFFENQGKGAFVAGPEVPTEFMNSNMCSPCPPNTYKDFVGNTECTPCPNRLVAPSGAISVDECGRILHIGDYNAYMPVGRRTEHGLCTMMDGVKYCADLYEKE